MAVEFKPRFPEKTAYDFAKGRVLKIVRGDLCEEQVDAIVNAANSQLAHGGGVAGAIVRRGGSIIQEESDRLAPVRVGENVVTSAGRLPCRHVIHAVGPMWGEGNEEKKLQAAFYNALARASELGCETVSIPAISSGIFGFPKKRCAEIFVDAVARYFTDHPDSSLAEIRSVNIDNETFQVFLAEARGRALDDQGRP